MAKFRKKPVVIEAEQWTGAEPIKGLCVGMPTGACSTTGNMLGFRMNEYHIHTLEGAMRVSLGDWIICGVKGELYPCKPDIFAATYEAVDGHATIFLEAPAELDAMEGKS